MNTEKTIAILSIGLKHFDLFDGTRTHTHQTNYCFIEIEYLCVIISQKQLNKRLKRKQKNISVLFGISLYMKIGMKDKWEI